MTTHRSHGPRLAWKIHTDGDDRGIAELIFGPAGAMPATGTQTRRSSTRPELGILNWRWQLFNDQDREVLDLRATSLFDLSGG